MELEGGSLAALLSAVGRFYGTAVDLVMPPACVACHRSLDAHSAVCARCWRDIAFIRAPLCDVTGVPLPFDTGGRMVSARALAEPTAYDRARAVARHEGAMRKLVHQFKYGDRHEARPLFGRWLVEAGRDILDGADLIVPVPMGRLRLILRRYNQAAIVANEVARLSGVRVEPLALRRRKATARQVGLTRAQRLENVSGAFEVPGRRRMIVKEKRVVLIDDVITTGATVEACARALKRAGAAHVDVLALALVCEPAMLSA